jgi:transcriptional regulator with PAS, ATPase and Fis domain
MTGCENNWRDSLSCQRRYLRRDEEAVRLIEQSLFEAPVLITRQSGTGKELVAHAIHRLSNRADSSFIDINCAAFQESLLESELFGYEAGAFSGAKARKLGLIELADGGTLFLDEVTELPAQLQAKLLRAIETRTFFRVGGVRKVEVDVRIVAATNRNLDTVVSDGVFRSDLLYRVNGFQINLAPLRERPEDIEPLAHPPRLWNRVSELSPEALHCVATAGRQCKAVKNCLERGVLLSNNGRITLAERTQVVRPLRPRLSLRLRPKPASREFNPAALSTPTSLREVERQQILCFRTDWLAS